METTKFLELSKLNKYLRYIYKYLPYYFIKLLNEDLYTNCNLESLMT